MPAAQRALAALELLARRPGGETLAALSRSLRVSPSSLLALLTTLRQVGYVERSGDRYRVDAKVAALGATAAACLDLAGAFRLARERLTGGATADELERAAEPPRLPADGGPLTREELDAFLAGPVVAVLGYLDDAGSPASVPVRHSSMRTSSGSLTSWLLPALGARWVGSVGRHPGVSLTVSESDPPFRRVNIQGVASVLDDPDRAHDIRSGLAARYGGSEPLSSALVVRIDARHVVGRRGIVLRATTDAA